MADNIIMYRDGYGGGGSAGLPPSPCTGLIANPRSASVELTWTDPEDFVLTNDEIIVWGKSVVVRKTGSFPTSIDDGVVVVSSTVRQQYQTTPFVDTGLIDGTTYYYAVFAVSDSNAVTNKPATASATPIAYTVMTIEINEAESNPANMVSYYDDAVGMPTGLNTQATEAWQEFFGYRPCLFKDGQVLCYLNPNDYTKDVNGNSVNVGYGTEGVVMIEFPRRGIKWTKTGNVHRISVTKDPNSPDYTYYAHTRGTSKKDAFYLSAYPAYIYMYSDTNYSMTIEANHAVGIVGNPTAINCRYIREAAHKFGTNYEIFLYYQMMYIQIMYCFQFKNLNSNQVFGHGLLSQSLSDEVYEYYLKTGYLNTAGLNKGIGANKYGSPIKIFGIENLWGFRESIIDGIIITTDQKILTSTDNFNKDGNGYTDMGQCPMLNSSTKSVGGYMHSCVGTPELGFIGTDIESGMGASTTTYYCDNYSVNSSSITEFGTGFGTTMNGCGIFALDLTGNRASDYIPIALGESLTTHLSYV